MATNIIFRDGDRLTVAATHPTTPSSGDPVRFGDLPGIALGDEDADGDTVVQFQGVAEVSVKGIDGDGDSAVAAGDVIYYVDADTPVLSKKATGRRFGVALAAVTSGATATIRVRIGR